MSEPRATRSRPTTDRSLEQEARQALAQIESVLEQPPSELRQEVDRAENTVVRIRDRLIEQLRAEPEADQAPTPRVALEQVNQVLSLLAGVEYPVGAVYRHLLEEARDCLQRLLESGRLA